MISIDDALWLRSLGVADADIKARMTTDTQTEQTEQKQTTDTQTEQKTEQTEQKEQKEQKEEQKLTWQQKTETKPDQTTAVLMEVIKTLQAQNAKLAAGQGAGSDEKIEDMLLSLI